MSRILNELKNVTKKSNATGGIYAGTAAKHVKKTNKAITLLFVLTVLGGSVYFYYLKFKSVAPVAVVPAMGPKEKFAAQNREAILLYKSGKYEEAKEIWLALTTSKEPDVYVNLALAYKKLGEADESENALKIALDGKPNHAVALNNLALLYAMTDRPAEAQEFLKKSMAAPGGSPIFIYNLAAVYENTNQLGLSIEYYKQYISHPKADQKIAQRLEKRLPRLNSLYTYAKRSEEGG